MQAMPLIPCSVHTRRYNFILERNVTRVESKIRVLFLIAVIKVATSGMQ